jgi:hypothetical protein
MDRSTRFGGRVEKVIRRELFVFLRVAFINPEVYALLAGGYEVGGGGVQRKQVNQGDTHSSAVSV